MDFSPGQQRGDLLAAYAAIDKESGNPQNNEPKNDEPHDQPRARSPDLPLDRLGDDGGFGEQLLFRFFFEFFFELFIDGGIDIEIGYVVEVVLLEGVEADAQALFLPRADVGGGGDQILLLIDTENELDFRIALRCGLDIVDDEAAYVEGILQFLPVTSIEVDLNAGLIVVDRGQNQPLFLLRSFLDNREIGAVGNFYSYCGIAHDYSFQGSRILFSRGRFVNVTIS